MASDTNSFVSAEESMPAQDRNLKNGKGSETNDNDSVASEDSEMEPCDDYKPKLAELLHQIGLSECDIEPIQHGYEFQNCVYAVSSPNKPSGPYVLRVGVNSVLEESTGRCEQLERDLALLGYLKDKLPVPLVKAYSVTQDNAVSLPYTLQTRIPGEPLSKLWTQLDATSK